jgi:predicted nucleic acid-binding protein
MPSREEAYFDTSVLVKQYVEEAGSAGARRLFLRFQVVSSALTPVEMMSALARRRAARETPPSHVERALTQIRVEQGHWRLIQIDSLVLGRAEALVRDHALRTLDAIHVASALVYGDALGVRLPFVTADERQRDVAARLALDVMRVG